ncbi:MAG TPA: DNA polymerase III subunit gamma and tau [Micromonosporaceae bacterium]|nr:DNA polymerase III subunit gamma and tau [Micromonosporaceae bacterium]
MALALYRKYRPRTFAEVIGQDHVTEPLMQALRTGRLHHAYLFSGPRGCGKTSSARILARSLNCEKGPTPEPCGECESCVALAPDGPGSVDVIEIDAASHGGVDDARDLRERAFFAPVASRFKVYVIDEAHMVSAQGFNALLKLVEEPPEYVKFVFATTEPEKVLGTIKSRTHHYPFRLIPPSVLRPYLEKLCREEGVAVEPAVFPLVVRAGAGSVRDSLSVLDQLIAGAGPSGVTYARAVALLGVTDAALIDEMVDALGAGDGAAAFATIDRVADAGHDPRRFASDLLERFRDLIILQQVPDAASTGIIEAPEDQLERMTAQAARIGQATLSRFADIAHNGLTEMRGTTAPRLLLELIVARMLLPAAEESHSALLQRLERMERRLGATEPAAATDQPRPPSAPPEPPARAAAPSPASGATPAAAPAAPRPDAASTGARREPASRPAPADPPAPPASAGQARPAQAAEPGALDAAAIRRVWDEVLTIAGRKSRRLAAIARDGVVRDLDGDTVVLLFKSSFHANSVRDNPEPLVEALHEVLGGQWQIRVELGGEQDRRSDNRAFDTRPIQTVPAPGPREDEDWPTPAQPGGGQPASRGSDRSARPARPAGSRAKGTASKRSPTAGSRTPAPASGPAAPPAYEGFDPGDEPLDDVVEPSSRQTSHDQALRTLTETFEVETIGDTEV